MRLPEGARAVARYLTVGTAIVDVVSDSVHPVAGAGARCTGCTVGRWDAVTESAVDWFEGSKDPAAAALAACVVRMSEWAQTHAETCRAMPRPGGAS